jgi:hypothetical protein
MTKGRRRKDVCGKQRFIFSNSAIWSMPHEVSLFLGFGFSCKRNEHPYLEFCTKEGAVLIYRMIAAMLDFLESIAVFDGIPLRRSFEIVCGVYGRIQSDMPFLFHCVVR